MAERDDSLKALPRGTVTLLFADVERSTRLLHALGARFGPLRARLRELIRATAFAHGGLAVDWAGDGVFLAFPRARNAVLAAVELQRALALEPWPPDGVIRLRIGIHTGEPELGDEGYVGMDVHLGARICAAAHGGQIVVSGATRDVVGDASLSEASFLPLGRHRLKDVPRAEQLFQLVAPGLDEAFPPLRTLGGATLPALHHRLVGRQDALLRVEALLERPEVRLVTMTGAGGAGKSRLALEVAARAARERPIHLVGLAPISDPDHLPAAIARAIGVRESVGRPLIETIAEALTGTGTLLFLDNFEHLAPAARVIATLLNLAPDLVVMTTSRAPLRLSGEHVLQLDPLPIDDAATLFVELAATQGVVLREDALASVREICRRLDGLPLAIELVAARLIVLAPAQILSALDEGLALEMEGPIDLPERQRTLHATIEWSYGLLGASQQELHGVLSVFAGGCTLDDARAIVASGSGFLGDLESLVAWSLVRREATDGEARFSMLETVREDAILRLSSQGKLADLRRRHAERFLALATDAEAELAGPRQADWLERLEHELDNVRATLDFCLTSGRIEDALRALSSLERFWRSHGHVSEARRWLASALALADGVPDDVRADALWTAAQQATAQFDWPAAVPLLEEALALFRRSGRGRQAVFALSDLGFVALVRDDLGRAAKLCEEALAAARDLDDDRALSAALNNLGEVRSLYGDHVRALALYEEAVALRRGLGDPLLIADAMYSLGVAAFRGGDSVRARAACRESLGLAREVSAALHVAAAQFMLAELDLLGGDAEAAREAIGESLSIYTELENERARAGCLVVLSGIAVAKGSFEEAARLSGAADALRGDSPLNPFELTVLERFHPELEAALGKDGLAAAMVIGAQEE